VRLKITVKGSIITHLAFVPLWSAAEKWFLKAFSAPSKIHRPLKGAWEKSPFYSIIESVALL
jgi:hypothetical protein